MTIDDYWTDCKYALRQYSHYRLLEQLHNERHLTSQAFFAIRARLLWSEQHPIILPVEEEHHALPSERTGKEAATCTMPTRRMGAMTMTMATEVRGA